MRIGDRPIGARTFHIASPFVSDSPTKCDAHIRKQKNALTFQGGHVTQTANMVVAATLGFGAALKVFNLMV